MRTKVIKIGIIAFLISSSFQILNCSQDNNKVSNDVAQLVSDLKHGDLATRWEAIQRIEELGPKARSAIPALIDALGDEHFQISSDASIALAYVGESSIPELIVALENNPNPEIRGKAAETLALFNIQPSTIIPALITAFSDDELNNLPFIITRMGEPTIDFLLDAYESHDGRNKAEIVMTLWLIGLENNVPSEIFYESLDDESILVNLEGAAGISYIKKDYETALPYLIKGLKDDNLEARRKAAEYLGIPDAGFDAAIPDLIIALEDDDKKVRNAASIALGEIGSTAIPQVLTQLENDRPHTRYAAVNSIRLMGEDANEAIPALQKYLSDEDNEVRFITAVTLYELGYEGESLINVLIERLDNCESNPFQALRILGDLGSKAEGAIPALEALSINDENEGVRKAAQETLGKIEAALVT